MNDKDYFAQYIKAFEMIFSANHIAFVKDAEFKYQAVTDKMTELIGFNPKQGMLNKTATEVAQILEFQNRKIVEQWHQQDLSIQHDKKFKTYIEILSCNGKNIIHTLYKTPIINPETGNLVGIKGLVTNLVMPHIIKTLFKIHGSKGLTTKIKNNRNPLFEYPLSDIQHKVLFLAINNYSYSEISILLSEFGYEVSSSRVNDYLEQLKLIFHVRNKTQLIEKAISLNLHCYLPNRLFTKEISIEITLEDTAYICNCNIKE